MEETDLRNDGDLLSKVLKPDGRDVDSVDGNASARELGESQETHSESALSRSVRAEI